MLDKKVGAHGEVWGTDFLLSAPRRGGANGIPKNASRRLRAFGGLWVPLAP